MQRVSHPDLLQGSELRLTVPSKLGSFYLRELQVQLLPMSLSAKSVSSQPGQPHDKKSQMQLVMGQRSWLLAYGDWTLAAREVLALCTCSLFRIRVPSEGFKTWKDDFWNHSFVNCINLGVPLLLSLK